MADESEVSTETCNSARSLFVLGLISACGYAALLWLSRQFASGISDIEKPTVWMLSIFALEFFCYGAALWLAVRLKPTKKLLCGIVGGACLFRAILLPSVPMHEIDIYRYIWDGAVLAEGISPYRYSPEQVREVIQEPLESQSEDFRKLVALQARSESLTASLQKIHYGNLSSPYPPVSQAVFAGAALVTPAGVTPHVRMVAMKLLLVLFDLATLLVVIGLLREANLHVGLSIAYGWCPLMMKEIANGGHLDSIAIFFTTLAIWFLVRCGCHLKGKSIGMATLSGGVLALAIGAKIYPVVLIPLFVAVWWRRCGMATAMTGISATTLLTAILLAPMFAPTVLDHTSIAEAEPLINQQDNFETNEEPSAGLLVFFKKWEMNDLLFMVLLENLRPQADVAPEAKPWFVVVPDAWSNVVVSNFVSLASKMKSLFVTELPSQRASPKNAAQDLKGASFLLARVITVGFLGLVACWLAWRAAAGHDPQAWCRAAMLTLAWFWLISPTQNPWYWCWVLPLLPFARYRTWYLMAGCSLLYYLRFWLIAHYPDPPLLGTRYDGEYFFYFVVAWIEFAPCLLFLSLEWLWARFSR